MKNIRIYYLCAFFIVLLTACSSANIKSNYSLNKNNEIGLLVVSLVRSGAVGFNMFADIKGVNSKYNNSITVTNLLASKDWDCPMFGEIPKAKPCGRLAVIEMPKGEYEFYAWHGRLGGNYTIRSIKKFSKKFKIYSGKATYIGNIHFIMSRKETGKYLLGMPVKKLRFDIEISNIQDRDLSLFYKKYPKIAAEKVQVKIIQ